MDATHTHISKMNFIIFRINFHVITFTIKRYNINFFSDLKFLKPLLHKSVSRFSWQYILLEVLMNNARVYILLVINTENEFLSCCMCRNIVNKNITQNLFEFVCCFSDDFSVFVKILNLRHFIAISFRILLHCNRSISNHDESLDILHKDILANAFMEI